MSVFLGVLKYEFWMSSRRKGLLILALLFSAFFLYLLLDGGTAAAPAALSNDELRAEAGHTVFFINLFFPVIAGIAAADRLVRDYKLGTRELLRAAGIRTSTYVLGKYVGVAVSLLSIELLIVLPVGLLLVFAAGYPAVFAAYLLLAFATISAPAILMVTGFSFAVPMILPLRIYQILFTGYWYWGNYLSPSVLPTVSDTILNASGRYTLEALFGAIISIGQEPVSIRFALTNMAVLVLGGCCALAALTIFIRSNESRS